MKCPNCQSENKPDSRFCHNCATPLKDDQGDFATIKTLQFQSFELSRGDLFAGRYEIIEDLGEGGMGKVYRAFDKKVKEVVALKLIRPEIGVNIKAIERFRNELKIARKISHRNICRMYDLGEEGLIHYITMEYVAGEDLKRFVKRAGSLTSGKAIVIARQVGEGLVEAHRLGVIHRDLKPQNIMIDQEGNARIMDFGIARFVDTDKLTGSGVMIGTPEYMSPEQAELKEVDSRADIYSLGVVLYEMVTGKVPFEGETPLSIAMKHKTEKPKNVREINALISKELSGIIAKCMEKEPAKRYQTAKELITDLNRVEQGLSTQEREIPKKMKIPTRQVKAAKPKKTKSSNKFLLPVAAALILIFVVVIYMQFFPKKSSPIPEIQEEGQVVEGMPEGEESGVESGAPEKKSERKKTTKSKKKTKTEPKAVTARPEAESPPAESRTQPKLSADIVDMDSAQLGMARLHAAKVQAEKKNLDENTLFYRLAVVRESEVDKLFSRKNYLETRSLCAVLEKLIRISIDKNNDEGRFKSLEKYVDELQKKVEKASKTTAETDLYTSGMNHEKQGAALLGQKDFENSVKAYMQAADAFEKALLVIQSREEN
ncbi:MAG: protein kinase [Candidatus Aminicenantes bacterium]|nr:protein kinase [Candidatus Aminicenantes bacterium]